MIMTLLTEPNVTVFTTFLTNMVTYFGPTGTHSAVFSLFQSTGYGDAGSTDQTHNLMFSDFTKNIYIPPDEETATYYRWTNATFLEALKKLDQCPLPTMGWCVIDEFEMDKCQRMSSAFGARSIKPDLSCIQADSVLDCMRLIQDGYADMVTLEAGDLYAAGKYFGLVPIVAENYAVGQHYYAVAVVKKVNPNLLVSNWRHRFTCHGGVGKATGWIVPINTVLDTRQVIVLDGHLIFAYGELISRACIPGILNSPYDRTNTNSLNLCELCIGGNKDRCRRDHLELYYGDAGAFRCLTEGADIAFTRHTTVHTNTAGRNPNYWARNLREDDYEILCPDGRRAEVDQWATCNLAKIPSNVVVTASYKSENERTNMWRLLQYGQEYYSSDKNSTFQLFDSGFGHKDLIFSDDTESLSRIPWENQTYERWLGPRFLRLVENLESVSRIHEAGIYAAAHHIRGEVVLLCIPIHITWSYLFDA
ncbi:Family S60 non-peptidase ue (S60 family) [Fasciolopsis buskii]|uniref:Family S60 non-peptidase ue (S60 family) n=1 Tax=Fasciolopsis buskii TaxID=27845 RepID=A0A8E0RPD8_9TREM|nr:Family S60 non-peptidase ue (S60 family) [Fasciolopsis buski]